MLCCAKKYCQVWQPKFTWVLYPAPLPFSNPGSYTYCEQSSLQNEKEA